VAGSVDGSGASSGSANRDARLAGLRRYGPELVFSSAASSYESLFQEALFHEAEFQDALFHDALFQEAEFHEALFQDALFHEALFQEAEFYEALFHEALVFAELTQLALSKASPFAMCPLPDLTNSSSAAFGFGGSLTWVAALAVISPTPPASPAPGIVRAVSISAPFTSSGVNLGCRARMSAAAPATTGAANDVPESCM
jgi:hypothetical protein